MTAVLQTLALLLVGVAGTCVVLTRDAWRGVVVLGFFGLTLVLLFALLAAPDVALSQLAVGVVFVPVVLFSALRRIRDEP